MNLGSCNMKDCFAAVGAVVVCYITLRAVSIGLRFLRTYVLSGALGLHTDLRRTGQWAVVTGSTDGIGKAYAEQLAGKGLNIVLISRTEYKLRKVAAEIEAAHQVNTRIITADFTKGAPIYDVIRTGLVGLDIGVLVNNVGLGQDAPCLFLDVADREKFFMDQIQVNCSAMTMMCSIVMPGMVSRKRGVVINLSSGLGEVPSPFIAVYSSTKAYMWFLSECLRLEYRSKGIVVQCVLPNFVATKMSILDRPSTFVPTPTSYVRAALNTVGLESVSRGYWAHSLQAGLWKVIQQIPFLPEMMFSLLLKDWKKRSSQCSKELEKKKPELGKDE